MWLKCVSYLWHTIPIPQSGQQPAFLYFTDGSSGIVLNCYRKESAMTRFHTWCQTSAACSKANPVQAQRRNGTLADTSVTERMMPVIYLGGVAFHSCTREQVGPRISAFLCGGVMPNPELMKDPKLATDPACSLARAWYMGESASTSRH